VGGTSDRYMRGIIFTTSASGTFRVFDYWSLAFRVASVVVFLGIATAITSVVAFNLLPESKVYKSSYKTPLDVNREYSKMAGHAVVLARLFEHVGDGNGQVDKQQIKKMLQGHDNMTESDASNLADQIVDESDQHRAVDPNNQEQVNSGYGDLYEYGVLNFDPTMENHKQMIESGEMRKGYLNFTEFVDCVTEDTMTLTQLRATLRLDDHDFDTSESMDTESQQPSLKRQSTHRNRLPPPHEHVEVCRAKDGRTYYKNHATRQTSWQDPRGMSFRGSPTVRPSSNASL